MRVVREAVVLLLGIVDHEPELRALTGQLAVGQAAQPRKDCCQSRRIATLEQTLADFSRAAPLGHHPLQFFDEESGHYAQVLGPTGAIAASAVLERHNRWQDAGRRRVPYHWACAQSKLDGVITDRDVGLDAPRFLRTFVNKFFVIWDVLTVRPPILMERLAMTLAA